MPSDRSTRRQRRINPGHPRAGRHLERHRRRIIRRVRVILAHEVRTHRSRELHPVITSGQTRHHIGTIGIRHRRPRTPTGHSSRKGRHVDTLHRVAIVIGDVPGDRSANRQRGIDPRHGRTRRHVHRHRHRIVGRVRVILAHQVRPHRARELHPIVPSRQTRDHIHTVDVGHRRLGHVTGHPGRAGRHVDTLHRLTLVVGDVPGDRSTRGQRRIDPRHRRARRHLHRHRQRIVGRVRVILADQSRPERGRKLHPIIANRQAGDHVHTIGVRRCRPKTATGHRGRTGPYDATLHRVDPRDR